MRRKRNTRTLRAIVVGASSVGMLYGATCTSDQIRTAALGIEAVAGVIASGSADTDISFGDWISSEFDDSSRNDEISFGDWVSDELKDL